MRGKRELAPMATAIAATFCLAMSAPAIGQGTAGQDAGTQGSSSRAANPQQQRVPAQQARQANMQDIRASRLIGTNLHNAQGQDLGEVTDLVVDMSNGRVHYAVVEHGGVLGLGDKATAIPVSRLQTNARGNEFTLDMTERQLKDAPRLEPKAKWSDPGTWDQVGEYYTRTLGKAQGERRADTGAATAASSRVGARFQQATDLIGMEVVDQSGHDVGEVEDLVINLSNGAIHYAVLEFDREWNPDDKLVALPVSSLQPTRDGKELKVDKTREQIASAPSFDAGTWPDLRDRAFRDRVAGLGGGTTGMDRSTATPTITTIVIIDEPQFTRLDTDRDGRLSRSEVKAFTRLTENWNSVDRNRDGYLSRDELNDRLSTAGTSTSQSGTTVGSATSSSMSSGSTQKEGSSGTTAR